MNFIDELKEYLNSTSKEQVLKDFKESSVQCDVPFKIAEDVVNKTSVLHNVMPRLFSVSLCFQKQIKGDVINIGNVCRVLTAHSKNEALGIVLNSDHEYKEHVLHTKIVFEIDIDSIIENGA